MINDSIADEFYRPWKLFLLQVSSEAALIDHIRVTCASVRHHSYAKMCFLYMFIFIQVKVIFMLKVLHNHLCK